jgi:DNA-binding protein HU-beta
MTKTELVSKVAEKAGLSKKDAEKASSAVIESIIEALASGDKVQFVGFGTFEVHHRPERIGHNPRTKEEITIPASDYPVFKAGKSFKEAIAK